jgi:hypothetical protein
MNLGTGIMSLHLVFKSTLAFGEFFFEVLLHRL